MGLKILFQIFSRASAKNQSKRYAMNSTTTVKKALNDYYKTHDFGSDFSTAKWFYVRMGPLKIPIPNSEQRRRAIYLHDLSHILTGYDTSWTGEGEIAAWELASGFSLKYWMGWVYPPITFFIGLLISPIKVTKAFRRGWRKPNLYKIDYPKEKIEQMTIGELRTELDIPDSQELACTLDVVFAHRLTSTLVSTEAFFANNMISQYTHTESSVSLILLCLPISLDLF